MAKTIEIDVGRYADLLKTELKMQFLDNGGVDNWEWYGESLNPDGEKSYEELCDEIDEEWPDQ